MSSRSSKTASARSGGAASGGGSTLWIVIWVVVVVIGVFAVFLARGADDKPPIEEETAAVALDAPASGLPEGVVPVQEGGLPPIAEDGTDAAVGMTIPTVSGVTVDDEPITIGPDDGPQIIVFMAHWCGHCQKEIPRLVEHFAEAGEPEGVAVVGVSTNVGPDSGNYPPSRWLEREDWTLPTLKDSQESTAYGLFGVTGFPYFVVVDADGRVVVRTSGELTTETFDRLVELAREGTQPT